MDALATLLSRKRDSCNSVGYVKSFQIFCTLHTHLKVFDDLL